MTSVADGVRRVGRRRADARSPEGSRDVAERELPAWPVLALLWGLPLWWMLGLLPFYLAIMSVAMVAYLIHRGRVELVPGVVPWAAFVVWMLPCAMMLDSLSRIVGFGLRFSQFAGVAVALVYLVNARRSIPVGRVLSGLTFTWCFIVVCGYLGMWWPDGVLTFTVGRLLPAPLLESEYVNDLVFPRFAEVQDPWGADEPFVRPSAPFAYTNGWGAALVVLTPVAVAWALERGRTWSVALVVAAAALAVPPAVASSNRGLFIGVLTGIAYVLLRLIFRGRWIAVAWVAAFAGGVAFLLSASGALEAISARQEVVDTTEGRSLLYEETLARTLESPIIGYGSPRPSFTSEITVGTQGALWNTMFCFGLVGLLLLAWFLIGAFVRTAAAPNTAAIWMHAALLNAIVMGVFYGLDRHFITIALIAGLLLRERYSPSSTFWKSHARLGPDHAA